MNNQRGHELEIKDVFELFKTSKEGLSLTDAKKRLAQYGPNDFKPKSSIPFLPILIEQVINPLIIILLLISVLNYLTGHTLDGNVIIFIVIINTSIGCYQEFKSRTAVKSLTNSALNYVKVVREKEYREILAEELVPGDILMLETGDKVAADGRLFEINDLRVDEASLTGESLPVAKEERVCALDTLLADMKNMAFAGTLVTSGNAHMIVTNTGFSTQFGTIAKSLEEEETPKTTLEQQIEKITKLIIKVVGSTIGIIFIIALIRKYSFLESFSISSALAISAIPEGLPAIITITLAIGVNNLLKKNALMQDLESVETLGQISVIATDKTGTLTENKLTVTKIFLHNKEYKITGNGYEPKGDFIDETGEKVNKKDENLNYFLSTGMLCNNAELIFESKDNEGWKIIGDPTEGAIIVAGEKNDFDHDQIREQFKKIDEIPFSTKTRLMATLHKYKNDQNLLIVKGAPEVILSLCSKDGINSKRIDSKIKKKLMEEFERYAAQGFRVLALSVKKFKKDNEKIEHSELKNLEFLGFYIMEDVPRIGVKDAIVKAYSAGIRVIMITGDNPSTAKAISEQIGLEKTTVALTGKDLDSMNDTKLFHEIKECNIFARISPMQKLRLVKILQLHKQIVAVTGDGINDAPSIKAANVGVAMGKKGTAVSREAAALVLLDDHFSSIVTAIESGRTIFQNIKRVLYYLISTSVGEVLIVSSALILGLPLPLTAIQILWINIICETINATPLVYEPAHKNLMNRPPRSKEEGFFNSTIYFRMILVGLAMMFASIPLFSYYAKTDVDNARTFVFVVATLSQLFNVLNAQSFNNSILKFTNIRNFWPLVTISISMILLYILVEVKLFQNIFSTSGLSTNQWLIAYLVSFSVIILIEIHKFLRNDKDKI